MIALTQNIVKSYDEADLEKKRAYLRFFFKEIRVKEKKIVEVVYKPVISVLKQTNMVILSALLLEDRNVNITSQFVRIFKVFEDFRFIQQLREEMDKVRPVVMMAT